MADSTTTPVSHGDRVCLNLPINTHGKSKSKYSKVKSFIVNIVMKNHNQHKKDIITIKSNRDIVRDISARYI